MEEKDNNRNYMEFRANKYKSLRTLPARFELLQTSSTIASDIPVFDFPYFEISSYFILITSVLFMDILIYI